MVCVYSDDYMLGIEKCCANLYMSILGTVKTVPNFAHHRIQHADVVGETEMLGHVLCGMMHSLRSGISQPTAQTLVEIVETVARAPHGGRWLQSCGISIRAIVEILLQSRNMVDNSDEHNLTSIRINLAKVCSSIADSCIHTGLFVIDRVSCHQERHHWIEHWSQWFQIRIQLEMKVPTGY